MAKRGGAYFEIGKKKFLSGGILAGKIKTNLFWIFFGGGPRGGQNLCLDYEMRKFIKGPSYSFIYFQDGVAPNSKGISSLWGKKNLKKAFCRIFNGEIWANIIFKLGLFISQEEYGGGDFSLERGGAFWRASSNKKMKAK